MSKSHFFFGLDVLNHLLNIEVEMTDCRAEFTFDLIEIPFWMEYSAIGNNIDLKAYKRGELYSRDPESSIEAGFLSVDKESGNLQWSRVECQSDAKGFAGNDGEDCGKL